MQSVTYNQNTITVGESVLINPDTPDGLPYVALVKGIRPPAIPGGEPILDVVWYYRPEEAVGGRKVGAAVVVVVGWWWWCGGLCVWLPGSERL
jgi:hypothetical protein